jgi:RHS repeat-associated protein
MGWIGSFLGWGLASVRGRGAGRRGSRLLTGSVAGALVLPLLAGGFQPPPGGGQPGPAALRPAPAQKPVRVYPVRTHKMTVPVIPSWHRPAVSWPSGTGSADVAAGGTAGSHPAAEPSGGWNNAAMAGPSAGSVRAGTLPVWVGPELATAPRAHPAVTAVRGRLTVSIAPRRAAMAAGLSGVIIDVSHPAGTGIAAGAHVSLDYRSFAYADGGDFAARLHLVELPGCVLTKPRAAACRTQTPLASGDDVADLRLGADVTLPAATGQVVVAAVTSTSGSAGNFAATPLSEAGSWAEGGSSGAFTYSYPIEMPPVPGGLAPQVNLGYNSQTVDGLTSSTNNQASWIGDGWDYEPGYIQRDYESCAQTSKKTGDLCTSSSDTTTLSLNGTQTTLVDDPSTGWHAEADNGDRISYKTGTTNGTTDGDYWVVTDPDGTSYYFGLNELPGFQSGDAQTNSAWTVPVYNPTSGKSCYNPACNEAWQWNLDYVTDSHGDAMAFFYNTETNYYAADGGSTATASYVQAGALAKIEYGLRAGDVYGVTPAGEAVFTAPQDRTDVPTGSSDDLACSSGATCDVQSPTFWTRYRLSTIATYSDENGSLAPVDSWALKQNYPATNDETTTPSLWLEQITRTGEDGSSPALPPVQFTPVGEANRVEDTQQCGDGYSLLTRMRMYIVTSETGGQTVVTYDTPQFSQCTTGTFPAPDNNQTLNYPDWWTPPGGASREDWFNKYVVSEVVQQNTVGGGTPVPTRYFYASAAWHYDDDTLVQSDQRTWDQWRGYQTVTTETGVSDPDTDNVVTEMTDTYFQGMNGDHQSGGGTTSASLTSTEGNDEVTDYDQYAGLEFEKTVYDGVGGAMVSDAVTVPWTSAATATQTQSGLPALQAFMTGTQEAQVFTPLALGGTRESETTYTHDSYGRVTTESSIPDASDPSEDTCTTTSYSTNTTSWLLDMASEVDVVSVPCGSTVSLPADAVSDTLTFYDGSTTLGAPPTAGNVTMTQLVTSYNGSTPVYNTQSTSTYDEYGRVLTATDADNRTTTTSYTPATGAEPTSVTVTDPMNLATTTTYDPARDLPLTVTNPAGWVTSETYDALGRLTGVWKPGHPEGTLPADYTYSYQVSNTEPSVVTTNTINESGSYVPSETLYDSLGRPVETQTETFDGNRDVTDSIYNSDGWDILDSNSYYTKGAPDGTLVAAPADQVPSETGYVYDGDGRVIQQMAEKFGTETWETGTSYGGDYTTVVPPAGGTPETTFTNAEGKTSAIYQYHAGVPDNPSDPASDYDETTYSYTPADQLAGIQDAAGNTWSYTYDLAGEQKTSSDPDAGASTSTYDPAGQLMTTTDARGSQISYTYDADGRKTAEYDTTGGAAETGSDELASWTYDTLAKGEPTSSASYVGGTGGASYMEAVASYNKFGLPSASETVVSSGPLAGTYKQTFGYSPTNDLISSYYDTAVGGLPEELVNIGYNNVNQPESIGSSIGYYVANLSYTELGQPQEYAFGTTTEPAWLTNTYNQETGQLSSADVTTGSTSGNTVTVDDTAYGYDNDGNVTSESDTPAGDAAADDVQCFQYDYLGRLSQAWAQGGTGACASTPSQSVEGGAAAYWSTYHYNDENDLTSEVSTPPSGAATTTTSSYPPAGSAQPHAVSSQKASGPSGTTTTSYGYNADGDTTSITSPSSTQNLSWNDAGQLTSDATTGQGAGTTSYVYDASGNLLQQTDPSGTTLYLPDEQVTDSNGTISATRYYALGGVSVAARTGSPGTQNQVYYLSSNLQGTATVVINANTLAATHRYYDPYGNQIGTAPADWPGSRGFVGGTADPATGLTNLGAREYNPAASAFVSPDPLLAPTDPQDLNPYAYATDSPATDEDPSGAMVCINGGCGTVKALAGEPGAYGGPDKPATFDVTSYYINPDVNWGFWSGAAAYDHLAPALGAPAPQLVVRTVRAVTAAQASNGQPSCAGKFAGMACWDQHTAQTEHGSSIGGLLTAAALTVGGIGLTAINIAQAGADPGTDALEAADLGALADNLTTDDSDATPEEGGTPSQLVYRGGSTQPGNLTPRVGIDNTGLSTYDNPEAAAPNGGKVQVIDTSLLKLAIIYTVRVPKP